MTPQELISQIQIKEENDQTLKLARYAAMCMNNDELDAFAEQCLPDEWHFRLIVDHAKELNDYKVQTETKKREKNHSVAELMEWYNNKKSRKVEPARRELQKRFLYLSHDEQIQVMTSMLRGNKQDRLWCYKTLCKWWSDELLDPVIALWDDTHEERCGWLLVRYCTVEQLQPRANDLSYLSNYSRLCQRLAAEPWFQIDKEKLRRVCSTELNYLWIMSLTPNGLPEHEAWEVFYQALANFLYQVDPKLAPWNKIVVQEQFLAHIDYLFETAFSEDYFHITSIKGIDKMLSSLIKMGYYRQVEAFLEWETNLQRQFQYEYADCFDPNGKLRTYSKEYLKEIYQRFAQFVFHHFPTEYQSVFGLEKEEEEYYCIVNQLMLWR